MNDTITTAIAHDGTTTRIEYATPKHRYHGLGHHKGCELYPVFRGEGRQSSFAHMPNRLSCLPPRGESYEHKQAKEQWLEFLEDRLSGCLFYATQGRRSVPHLHDPYDSSMPKDPDPLRTEILWICGECQKPHTFDLLKKAYSAVSEKWQFERSVKPDITILNSRELPMVFIEFRKSHLSPKIEEVAETHGIPLFVVDIIDGTSMQGGLYNPQRRWPQRRWYDNIDMPAESKAFMRQSDSIRLPNSYSCDFTSIFDDNGRPVDHTLKIDGEPMFPIPSPNFGHYLFATWSNIECGELAARREAERDSPSITSAITSA